MKRFDFIEISAAVRKAAAVAVEKSLCVKPGERALIITNPASDVFILSAALNDAVADAQGIPLIMVQESKTQFDFADDSVYEAQKTKPDIVISMSHNKMGKDRRLLSSPIKTDGKEWDNYFHYLMHGEKSIRGFWAPGTTMESFSRTVNVDYDVMKKRAAWLKARLDDAISVKITSPGGTDLEFSLRGRKAKLDDGDFSAPGTGGNLPAGEAFISPALSSATGVIVFDGSIATAQGTLLIHHPIHVFLEGGFITRIEGSHEADVLRKTLEDSATKAHEMEKSGALKLGQAEIYARNAYAIGELGIGINEKARITGNMLEDEKAFKTCHLAIGANYDEDAPALNHLDGLIKKPTISLRDERNVQNDILIDGILPDI